MSEASPRPWRVMRFSEEDEPDRIIDANGDEVAIELLEDDAVLIVDAVNERAKFEAAHMEFPDFRPVIIAAGQRDAAIAERDRLRDIVRRAIPFIEGVVNAGALVNAEDPDIVPFLTQEQKDAARKAHEEAVPLLAEARAAIGEEEE